jgi:adenosine deaminase
LNSSQRHKTNWRQYKKVELHRHLEGAIRLQTIIDVSKEAGVTLPGKTVEELAPHALVTKPLKDLSTVLNKLWLIQSCLATEAILERITFENCEDAYNDGVRVLELRYSPGFINTNHPDLNYEKIFKAIMAGARKAELKYKDFVVGFICTISRDLSPRDAEMTAEFAIAHREAFVGFDLAGDEVGFRSTAFAPLFRKVASAGLGITVHSGEARVPDAPLFVRESISELGATRIGHGVQIIHDDSVIDFVKRNNVLLELCPSSNCLKTKAQGQIGRRKKDYHRASKKGLGRAGKAKFRY